MRFLLDDQQRDFVRALDALLAASDTPAVARAWARGDAAPGQALQLRLADAGVFALAVPEEFDGVGLLPVETALAFEQLGRHAVPGPAVETVASAVLLAELGEPALAKNWLPRLASGQASASLQLSPAPNAASSPFSSPWALDTDSTDVVLLVRGDELFLAAPSGAGLASLDPTRRLFAVEPTGPAVAAGPHVRAAAERAGRWAALATAAQSLGVGRALLEQTVAYVGQRRQFGTVIGSFQAVKHRLADALLALEFAQPLVHAAALSLDPVDIAMAKVAAGEAGYTAARTALQLHGAIGYTEELDLSLGLRKSRPLRDAWGAPAACRALVLAANRTGARA
ncbi:acyl-CoA dehydrogenase family protein [Streptacidiphilus fuscans]|uniref:Acyl-CoA dehydrogenase family protein n=1 Tax=Streptacidiphilus fuscans TaxID=2789292 RepID=A0A931B6P2_9ACTN|nr:acyl-CoA dehydrogenase family protein [Streptacidiphilus fuscans]MBF9070447.1 acyl-CoA dehydrogenase family protein [Streptacidiphilus fuscans]